MLNLRGRADRRGGSSEGVDVLVGTVGGEQFRPHCPVPGAGHFLGDRVPSANRRVAAPLEPLDTLALFGGISKG